MKKNPGRGCHRVGGVRIVSGKLDPPRRERGGLIRLRTTRPPTEGKGELSHGRTTRLQKQTEGGSSRHGMTQPPERIGVPKELKPLDPPQRPNANRGRTDKGGGEGTKTHPLPDTPGRSHPMAETAWHNEVRQEGRTCRQRRRREPAAQGTNPHTSPARLWPQPKATRTSVVSTKKRRLRWSEAQPARGLRRPRTAMGPQDTDTHSLRRGGTKPQEERERNGKRPTERRRRGAP